jgi:hypothetical protein
MEAAQNRGMERPVGNLGIEEFWGASVYTSISGLFYC